MDVTISIGDVYRCIGEGSSAPGARHIIITNIDYEQYHIYHKCASKQYHVGRTDFLLFIRTYEKVDRLTKLMIMGKEDNG